MKKTHLNALGRIFANDIEQALQPGSRVTGESRVHLPYQSKAKVYRELETDGMVRTDTVVVGSGWSAVKVTGWQLTALGHMTYCMLCEDD